jgi:hypothetical protein
MLPATATRVSSRAASDRAHRELQIAIGTWACDGKSNRNLCCIALLRPHSAYPSQGERHVVGQ